MMLEEVRKPTTWNCMQISADDASQQEPAKETLFWLKIKNDFTHLGRVELQVSEITQSLAFNGELCIKAPKVFTLPNDVVLAAFEGISIEAKKSIRNRGQLLSQKNIELKTKHAIDNSHGIMTTPSTFLCHARTLDNSHGSIQALEGAIQWFTGHNATLTNTHGTLFGKFGIQRINKHKQSVKDNLLINNLNNSHGRIISTSGPLEMFLDDIDNSYGLIQGYAKSIAISRFNNAYGKFLLSTDVDIYVDQLFTNDLGIVDSSGKISLHGNRWKNKGGTLHGRHGLTMHLANASNGKSGEIASSNGPLLITGTNRLKLSGKLSSAKGMYIVTTDGPLLLPHAYIDAKTQLVVIESHKHQIDAQGSFVDADSCQAAALEQLNIQSTIFRLSELSLKSSAAWIEAQHAEFHVSFDAKFEAKESIYFDDNKGQLAAMHVHCNTLSMKNGNFHILKDLYFETVRFCGINNRLQIDGTAVLQAERSLRSTKNHFRIKNGSLEQHSREWLLCQGDSVIANQILRNGCSIHIESGEDTAKSISNSANDHLILSGYDAEAQKELKFEGSTTILCNGQYTAPRMTVHADELWLNTITAQFKDSMALHADSKASILKLKGEGNSLRCVSAGELSVYQNELRVRKNYFDAKAIRLSSNAVEGDVKVNSKECQYIIENVFAKGDVSFKSSHADVYVIDNRIYEGGDLDLKAHKAVLSGADFQLTNICADTQEIAIDKVRIHAKRKIRFKGKKSVKATDVQVKSDQTKLESADLIDMQKVQLHSDTGTHLLTDGIALVNKCNLLGKAEIHAKNAMLSKSALTADKSLIITDIKDTFIAEQCGLKAQEIDLKHKHGQLLNTALVGEAIILTGATYTEESMLQGTQNVAALGPTLFAKSTSISSPSGKITLSNEMTFFLESMLQADSIDARGLSLTEVDTNENVKNALIRNVRQITLLSGHSKAGSLYEHAVRNINIQHKSEVGSFHQLNSRSIFAYQSAYEAQQISWQGASAVASQSSFSGNNVHMGVEGSLDGTGLSIRASAALSMVIGKGAILQDSVSVGCGGVSIAAKELLGDRMSIEAYSAQLQTQGLLRLPAARMHANHVKLFGASIYRAASNVHTQTLVEETSSPKHGVIDLEGSTTYATQSLSRSASKAIYHKGASTAAFQQHVNTPVFDVRSSGHTFLGGEAQFNVGTMFSNASTSLVGSGNVSIKSDSDHVVNGQISLDGHIEFEAPALNIATSIIARGVSAKALYGDIFFHKPVKADIGNFTASSYIFNLSKLRFNTGASFCSERLLNYGSIRTPGVLQVHQVAYSQIKDVKADKQLTLTSEGTIDLQEAIKTSGSLAVESYNGDVISHRPLEIGQDFYLKGKNLHHNATVNVCGTSFQETSGTMHFNHISYQVGFGMVSDVGTFFSDASDLTIHGQSFIKAIDFILSSRVNESSKSNDKYLKSSFGFKINNTGVVKNQLGSNFKHVGPLSLEIINEGVNDASNFLVDGDLYLKAR